jgi:hypothetical protein
VFVAKVGGTACDLSPDGKRLLVMTPVDSRGEAKGDHEVVLFQNFIGYLRQRVPASK